MGGKEGDKAEPYPMDSLVTSFDVKSRKKRPTKPGHLWPLLMVVLAPFIFFGIPTHLLCLKSGDPKASSMKDWLKSLYVPFNLISALPTSVLICATGFGTAAVLHWTWIIFDSLIVRGEVFFDDE
jgi:hypothetical protein